MTEETAEAGGNVPSETRRGPVAVKTKHKGERRTHAACTKHLYQIIDQAE